VTTAAISSGSATRANGLTQAPGSRRMRGGLSDHLGEFPFVDTALSDALFDGGSDHRPGRAGDDHCCGPGEVDDPPFLFR
jgi:hypothetical protein